MIKTTFNENPTTPGLLWKIYYYDPERVEVMKTFTNLDGTPAEAPEDLVLCILSVTEEGARYELTNADYYFVDNEGKWGGAYLTGLQDRDRLNIPHDPVKNGYWVNTDRWNEACRVWGADTDFPSARVEGVR